MGANFSSNLIRIFIRYLEKWVEAIKIIRTIVRATKEMILSKKIEVIMIGKVDTETKEVISKKNTVRADKVDTKTGITK